MYKLIIVDDEPLVKIGMETMIDYNKMGIEVVGTAPNGKIAFDMIRELEPHIVITDIKMPVMSGLELVEECNKSLTNSPQFIILTSFEEFDYVRRAMRSNVVDYIVKMELDPDLLVKTLEKAINILNKAGVNNKKDQYTSDVFINRFLNRLLNNLFSSEQEINEKLYRFNLDFSGKRFLSIFAKIDNINLDSLDYEENYNLYLNVINVAKLILSKYLKGYTVAYNQTAFGIILCFQSEEDIKETCQKILTHIRELCIRYFNVYLKFGVGSYVDSLLKLSSSFYEAQNALEYNRDPEKTISFYSEDEYISLQAPTIDIIEVNKRVIKALETYDVQGFSKIIEKLIYNIEHQVTIIEDSINIISGIIHLIINNLDNGEELLHEAFKDYPKSYQSIYSFTNKGDLVQYLNKLSKSILEKLVEQKDNPQNRIVIAAKRYIEENIYKKLSLNDVADAIDISPNYLSSIFKKYNAIGFNNYITIMKIRKARELLSEGNLKVYEVSDMLGFSSPYYFSTVYKKVTGESPTEKLHI
jgi:two-component system response regulator YesN